MRISGVLEAPRPLPTPLPRPTANPGGERCAMQHHGGPVHGAERCLAGLVPQPLLRNPCSGPAAPQAQEVQVALPGAPLAALCRAFVGGVDHEGQQVDGNCGAEYPQWQSACPDAPGEQGAPAHHQKQGGHCGGRGRSWL